MARRDSPKPADHELKDPLWTWKVFIDLEYESARNEGREPPFAETAMKRVYDILAAAAGQKQSLRVPKPITARDAEVLKRLRVMDTSRVYRAAHHYALDRWLDAVGGPKKLGRPRLNEQYLTEILVLKDQSKTVALAKMLGVSPDVLRKQIAAANARNRRK